MGTISPELNLVVAEALARWAAQNSYCAALPVAWLGNLHEMVVCYHTRLLESGAYEADAFAEDVYKLVCCYAVGFLRER